ncbi:hypothetical protein AU467_33550 [Mesorhizobium loti]|uniref:Uncharacterized protein n=1 Tax=Rhizobium loti TaxID=381 RepID=A0A101KM75_RHILI|nr:hypothetical protein AU467_33550 [Mesorhizobium loti]
MTAFTQFLGEKAERYIELRHSLGYSFSKQAGTLRAFVRYVERAQFDAPATRTMALDVARHMWNGHAGKRSFRHFIQRDRCGHMSGLSARSKTAGLDEIRDARG